jgi:hypothetical protein
LRPVSLIIVRFLKSAAIALACLAAVNVMAAERVCSPDAEKSLARVQTWMGLQDHFHRYGLGACDDGALSEAYSDRVDTLLKKKWKDVSTLAFLVKSDPEFLQFVLRHVDVTWEEGDAEKIAANARKQCPKSATALCAKIINAIDTMDWGPMLESMQSK